MATRGTQLLEPENCQRWFRATTRPNFYSERTLWGVLLGFIFDDHLTSSNQISSLQILQGFRGLRSQTETVALI